MASPSDVLQQLNNKLFTKQTTKKPDVEIDDGILDEDQAAKRFIGHYVRRGQGEYKKGGREDFVDVDTLQAGDVDDDYVTNRPGSLPYDDYNSLQTQRGLGFEQFVQKLKEQMVAGGQPGDDPAAVGAAAAGGDPTGGQVDTPEEMGAQAAMPPDQGGIPDETLQPGLGQPLPEEDTSKSPSDLGRIYELKKIYTRLTVIEAFLTESSDASLIESRSIVSKAIELFEILASNLSSYKPPRAPEETLDEIIVQYYRFLERVYESVAKYYKVRAKQQVKKDDLGPDQPKIKINLPEM